MASRCRNCRQISTAATVLPRASSWIYFFLLQHQALLHRFFSTHQQHPHYSFVTLPLVQDLIELAFDDLRGVSFKCCLHHVNNTLLQINLIIKLRHYRLLGCLLCQLDNQFTESLLSARFAAIHTSHHSNCKGDLNKGVWWEGDNLKNSLGIIDCCKA